MIIVAQGAFIETNIDGAIELIIKERTNSALEFTDNIVNLPNVIKWQVHKPECFSLRCNSIIDAETA